MLLITIGGTFFAYTFNIYGIKVLGSTIAGAYIYTQPFMATAIAIMMGKDSMESYKLFAAVFIFLGLYLASKNKKNRIQEVLQEKEERKTIKKILSYHKNTKVLQSK